MKWNRFNSDGTSMMHLQQDQLRPLSVTKSTQAAGTKGSAAAGAFFTMVQ